MQIDLNNPEEFTIDGVKALIASKDDSDNCQLRVTTEGIAFVSDIVGGKETDGLAFRLETWSQGGDYVGIAASNDTEWVTKIYNCLKSNWPQPSSNYIDSY